MIQKRFYKIHFVGIGGIGMSGIAELLHNQGYEVSGSDLKETETTRRLAKMGCTIYYGHHADHVKDAHVVVMSSAVHVDNPEIVAARNLQIPVIPRAEMLAELMRMKQGVAVAGSHGKTTTTSLIATVLNQAGLDPTIVIGGKLNSIDSNAKLGEGEYIVAEADESDGSFLKLNPILAIITNIDPEHMEHFKTMDNLREAFITFANKVPFYGAAIVCLDHPEIQRILPKIQKRIVTYGVSTQADLQATNIRQEEFETIFDLMIQQAPSGEIRVRMPGEHNALNALAAIATAHELGIDLATTKTALQAFEGIQRRFQLRHKINDILIIDDYGHHPREIEATLRAAKAGWPRRVIAIFQPHRYTRVRDLADEFHRCFYQADKLIVTDIYPAGESPIEGVHAKNLYEGILRHGHRDVTYIPDKADIAPSLVSLVQPGDMVITLGAGDVWKVGDELALRLKEGK
ncbi:MAG: UDP-N-acetylmuramate--L-alanine ligase [Deltaproteobacteria bacterium]|nr:MAG: UDP-N-acetylmuramate--L-alanine ligase [Deltaproteobacteria bacterium]